MNQFFVYNIISQKTTFFKEFAQTLRNPVNRSSLFIATQNLRFESGGLICFLIYKFILDKLIFPSYNALTAEEKSH